MSARFGGWVKTISSLYDARAIMCATLKGGGQDNGNGNGFLPRIARIARIVTTTATTTADSTADNTDNGERSRVAVTCVHLP